MSTGLTHRHDRICTEREDFVRESADLAASLWRQGAIKNRLIKSFASYVGGKGRSKVGDLRRSFKIQFDKKIRNQESEPYQERKINESLWGIGNWEDQDERSEEAIGDPDREREPRESQVQNMERGYR